MRVALLQYPIAWADKETNLRMAEERIAALAGKADVAVLPEMFATGFCTDHPELAETMDGEIIRRLQAVADKSGVAIVSSLICLPDSRHSIPDTPAKLRNRGFMIKPHAPMEIQDKRHLYAHGGEDLFFHPAQERCIFEYKGVKILLLVCYDLRFPVISDIEHLFNILITCLCAFFAEVSVQTSPRPVC